MNNEIIQRSWESGDKKMEWVQSYMPVLNSIKDRFIKEKPFAGLKITISIHLQEKTETSKSRQNDSLGHSRSRCTQENQAGN